MLCLNISYTYEMLLDSLNINALRVFEAVFRHKSMSKAAFELGLTQPGVSQHIEKLEQQLDIRLFDRVKKKLQPTYKSKILYDSCKASFGNIEETLSSISNFDFQYKGEFIIGLPIEFGNSFILPLIVEIKKIFPKMNFKIHYGFAAEMNQLLINDNMDLAFVDAYIMDSRVTLERVYTENHRLLCSKEYAKGKIIKLEKEALEKLDYVAYLDDAPLIKGYLRKELGDLKFNLNIVSKSMDVAGVATLINTGLGVGILPEHAIKKYLDEDKLVYLKNVGQKNDISLAYLSSKREEMPTKSLIEFFLERAR